MIEINLVPDVKQELIRAKQVKAYVVTGAVFVGLVSIGIVVLMALYLFVVQGARSGVADGDITELSKKLEKEADLDHMLTIQHQLTKIGEFHDQKNMDSRFFDLIGKLNPEAPNNVTFSLVNVDADTKTVRLEGQAVNGYVAADVLKKTILNTSFSFKDSNGSIQKVPLTDTVSLSDLSYGDDATGKKVLRFVMSFVYDPALFARSSEDASIVAPGRKDVTDSYLGLPQSLFSDRAVDQEEGSNG